jgi:hypothetical protein
MKLIFTIGVGFVDLNTCPREAWRSLTTEKPGWQGGEALANLLGLRGTRSDAQREYLLHRFSHLTACESGAGAMNGKRLDEANLSAESNSSKTESWISGSNEFT